MTVDGFDLEQFRALFYTEAEENVAGLEAALLGLDAAPEDTELMHTAFRAAHSLKGGSGIFGLTCISKFTHGLESLLDGLRTRAMAWDPALATLLFRSIDVLRSLLASRTEVLPPDAEALLGELSAYRQGPAAPALVAGPTLNPAAAAPTDRYTVGFVPSAKTFARGLDVLLVLRELGELTDVLETYADTSRIPSLDALDPSAFYVRWSFLVRADSRRIIEEVFEFVDGVADVAIEPWTASEGSGRPAVVVSIAPALVAIALPPHLATEAVAEPQILHIPKLRALDLGMRGPAPSLPPPVIKEARAGEPTLSLKLPSIAPAARPSLSPPGGGGAAAAAAGEGATVRIATKKLDRILDILGEVVIAKSMISEGLRHQAATQPQLREALATLERHTRELQDSVMSVRMVPMSTVFARYGRMVRELGTKLGKNVSLVLEGGETEIDRAMVEQLADPLTHLVRNAIDHGIERPDHRLAAGKPEAGQLKLVASHRGGNVVVEIMDDGRGLDLDRVRQKGIETGLLSPTDQPSLEALHMLVFQPGFSTAAEVTDVSGRGVGMDVVLRNVQALSGAISFTSQPGKGSNVSLQLPLTMAIIDGLLLRVGTSKLVVPLLSVVESLRPKQVHKGTVLNRAQVLHFRGTTIPLVPLSEILDIPCPAPDPTRGIVIIVEACDMTVGLVVDELVANTQVVVKSIESNYQSIEGISGATVLGDGTIALILDVGAINRKVAATEPSGVAMPKLAACG